MIERIGNIILDLDSYDGIDLYSEGEKEDNLLDIVKQYSGGDFNRIILEKKDWSVLYHLSSVRGNIVDFLPINKTDSVLEIGSGCGAITTILSSKAKVVTCIELSKKRSEINAYKNKDCINVKIKVGNFKNVEKLLKEKYDYITLIGVLEYAQEYIGGENPYKDLLILIKSHLKSNGKIIIAIENKLGLKYWAGCQEDHIDKFYEGIESYTTTNNVRTFSKNELKQLLEDSGYKNNTFYYPYPDYKLPSKIFSDKYLPKIGELNLNRRNFDKDRILTFDELKVYDTLIKEGLYPEFSNSFLVVAGREEM